MERLTSAAACRRITSKYPDYFTGGTGWHEYGVGRYRVNRRLGVDLIRVTNSDECRRITRHHPDYFTFDEDAWFSNPANYSVRWGENIGFAEAHGSGVYWIHCCYHTARGREAIELTKALLRNLFEKTSASTAVGCIAMENKKARWVARQGGLQSLGEVETESGLCELFYMVRTK